MEKTPEFFNRFTTSEYISLFPSEHVMMGTLCGSMLRKAVPIRSTIATGVMNNIMKLLMSLKKTVRSFMMRYASFIFST